MEVYEQPTKNSKYMSEGSLANFNRMNKHFGEKRKVLPRLKILIGMKVF